MSTLAELLQRAAAGTLPPTDAPCQRWKGRAQSWLRTSEGGFNPGLYTVRLIGKAQAAQFVIAHHYLRSFPADQLRFGLFEGRHLVGVCVLGVPVNVAVLTCAFPTLVPYTQSMGLLRLVLLDVVPANAESWFVAQVLDTAGRAGVRGVVAYCDPVAVEVDGVLLTPGHIGATYQSLSSYCLKPTKGRPKVHLPDGTVLNGRAITKIHKHEAGARAQVARLRSFGVALPDWSPQVDGKAWLTQAVGLLVRYGGAQKVGHPGYLRYAWPTGTPFQCRPVRRQLKRQAQEYPKADEWGLGT